jgi:hypothetical protein
MQVYALGGHPESALEPDSALAYLLHTSTSSSINFELYTLFIRQSRHLSVH